MACRCALPRTNNANDTLELMRRGDITGMSFAFSDNPHDRESVTYEQTNERSADGKEIWLRRVRKATGLYDVAIVTHPAYEQTSVVTREFADEIMREIDAQIEAHKRECGGGSDDDKDKRECGGSSDDDEDKRGCGGEETDEKKAAREQAERDANGGETNAEKEAREQRELEEQAEMARKTRELRQRMQRMKLSNRKF